MSEDKKTQEKGFPFSEYPSKLKDETWAQWEQRCRNQGYNMRELPKARVENESHKAYLQKEVRELSDKLAELKAQGIKVEPSTEIAQDESQGIFGLSPDEIF